MIEYIYFVKCPNCEDEHFGFFNDAKAHALSCLDLQPIITQVEVDRNDFGECVDSKDLGTVWSWEEMMDDAKVANETTFSKSETLGVDLDNDPEFLAIDNTLEDEVTTAKKSIADMSIADLVEAMEENEDDVECKWCNEIFDKSECRYEVDLGYLCGRCEAAIKSRGETLTFREDLEWHTYKITFVTEANPDNEQTTTFKTWQQDVEYAWRKSNSNIPHTTIKRIELVEDVAGDTSSVTEAVTLTPQQKDEIMCCVAVSFETGHQAFEDFRSFKREYPDLNSATLQMLWAYYNDLVAMGPAGFYEQFKDVYDFDPMFVQEYGDPEDIASEEDLFESIANYKENLRPCPECMEEAFDTETSTCLKCGFNNL